MQESNESFSLPIALIAKKTLLIGAGAVAWQKFEVLMSAKWEVCVWAREVADKRFTPYFETKSVESNTDSTLFQIRTIDANIDLDTLKNFEIIIDASGDSQLGAFLHSVRKKCGFLLNVVDTPNLCDFYFGSIVRRENVSVMVSTNGTSPILSQILRDKISAILPRTISALSHRLKNLRQIAPPKSKSDKDAIAKECQTALGKVLIIGCGPSDFGLLTLNALESFALLDVALFDNLIGAEILSHIKGLGIECVNVGKRKGVASFTQEQINELMLDYAKQGKIVGRLKGGDPVIFGRVWEEASFLHAHNIEVEYISGITSSLCGALYSGVAPTLRGVSSGALIVSAHLRESVFHTEWIAWLKDSPYTLIVLMAHSFAERIRDEALAQGIDANLPAAFISQVSHPSQKAIIGTLGELPQMAQMCENPSILIIGKAVRESLNMPFMGARIVLDSLS
ncbi:uroporphyrinogen-III C-methyltransferase [Helicobacter sp. 23-1048]